MQRHATIAAALTLSMSAPFALSAQVNRQGPDANTPRLLVAVFASNDRALGVQIADATRSRITTNVNIKTLYAIPRNDIVNYLESSGYKADSALGPGDLKELGKLLRADEVLLGSVSKTPTGIRVDARLALARDIAFAQPLPTVEAANVNDAAKAIEKSLSEARKQLPDYKTCWMNVTGRTYDKAIAPANAAIAKYPQATIARLCLAAAYQGMNLPADSVLRVTNEITKIDPKNSSVLRIAQAAYKQKAEAAAARGDTVTAAAASEQAVRALVGLMALEPSNAALGDQVVGELARLGKPKVALGIVDTLLAQNPGDAKLLQQKWRLALLAASTADSTSRQGFIATAVSSGEEMVRADTTMADSVYFERQIIAANALTPPRGIEFASRAVQKYPNSANFWTLKANAEKKAGQSQMALQSMQRAMSLNAQTPNGNLFIAQLFVDMNQADSAVAVARRAVAAGEDKKTWGAMLLGPTAQIFTASQKASDVPGFRRALALAQESDKLSPSPTAKFFIGAASFFIGADSYKEAQQTLEQANKSKSKTTKATLMAKACPSAKEAQDMFVLTQMNMGIGGAVDANTAKQLLQYVGQYGPAADQMATAACKK